MKVFKQFFLFLICCACALSWADYGGSTLYPDTVCSVSNRTLIVDGVAQTPTYSAQHTAENAARALSAKLGKTVYVRTPDMPCVTTWRANPTYSSAAASSSNRSSSSSRSSSSISSSRSSSSISSTSSSLGSACPPTGIYPMMTDLSGWANTSSLTVPVGATVVIGPHPYDIDAGWSWSGCGLASNEREVLIIAVNTCVATATFRNSCGGVSTHDFTINVIGSTQTSSSGSTSSASNSSAGAAYTLTWDAPTARENGAPLPLSELGGFAVRYADGRVVTTTPATRSLRVSAESVEIAAFDQQGLYSRYVAVTR
jgi:hypothetical protein